MLQKIIMMQKKNPKQKITIAHWRIISPARPGAEPRQYLSDTRLFFFQNCKPYSLLFTPTFDTITTSMEWVLSDTANT